jgi:hypothetical protein
MTTMDRRGTAKQAKSAWTGDAFGVARRADMLTTRGVAERSYSTPRHVVARRKRQRPGIVDEPHSPGSGHEAHT